MWNSNFCKTNPVFGFVFVSVMALCSLIEVLWNNTNDTKETMEAMALFIGERPGAFTPTKYTGQIR
jgi:hypothetical protein